MRSWSDGYSESSPSSSWSLGVAYTWLKKFTDELWWVLWVCLPPPAGGGMAEVVYNSHSLSWEIQRSRDRVCRLFACLPFTTNRTMESRGADTALSTVAVLSKRQ